MSRYFSNGTEGYAWMAEWCDRCANDHQAHVDHHEDGCPIIGSHLAFPEKERPKWVDLTDEYGFTFPPAVRCLSFTPCAACGEGGGGDDHRVPRSPLPGQLALFDAAPVPHPLAVNDPALVSR